MDSTRDRRQRNIHIRNAFEKAGAITAEPEDPNPDTRGFKDLLDRIYCERGVDFRGYARSTITRRPAG